MKVLCMKLSWQKYHYTFVETHRVYNTKSSRAIDYNKYHSSAGMLIVGEALCWWWVGDIQNLCFSLNFVLNLKLLQKIEVYCKTKQKSLERLESRYQTGPPEMTPKRTLLNQLTRECPLGHCQEGGKPESHYWNYPEHTTAAVVQRSESCHLHDS